MSFPASVNWWKPQDLQRQSGEKSFPFVVAQCLHSCCSTGWGCVDAAFVWKTLLPFTHIHTYVHTKLHRQMHNSNAPDREWRGIRVVLERWRSKRVCAGSFITQEMNSGLCGHLFSRYRVNWIMTTADWRGKDEQYWRAKGVVWRYGYVYMVMVRPDRISLVTMPLAWKHWEEHTKSKGSKSLNLLWVLYSHSHSCINNYR